MIFLLPILVFEIDQRHGDAIDALNGDVAREFLCRGTTPAEPDSGIFSERGRERHGQAACGAGPAVRRSVDTIRNNDQSTHGANARNQASTASASGNRWIAAVCRSEPTWMPNPPLAFAAAKASSSVRSSPTN